MKSNLTRVQAAAVAALRAKLDVNHPGFTGSDTIRAAFTPRISQAKGALMFPTWQELQDSAVWAVAGLYIHSWVLPLLDAIDGGGSQDPRDRRDDCGIISEGNRALAALEAAKTP